MTAPTPHNAAAKGDIADSVLLPGDPLRAKAIADAFLTDVVQYNSVRNMLGFTGTYRDRRISVQGTGMGMPSMSIYATELVRFYGVRTAIRVGSCGAIRSDVPLRSLVIATGAHTNSAMNRRRFGGIDYAAVASFELVEAAARLSAVRSIVTQVGTVLSSDSFYDDDTQLYDVLAAHGCLAIEMEAAALYTICAGAGARALCIATVSDHLVTHEATSAEERQTGFLTMAELALDIVVETTT